MTNKLREAAQRALDFIRNIDRDDNDRDYLSVTQCDELDACRDNLIAALRDAANWARPINYTPPHMGRKPMTDDEIWKNDTIMSANSGYGATFETLREIVRAIEAAHGITPADKQTDWSAA